jgi:hypothetical protein
MFNLIIFKFVYNLKKINSSLKNKSPFYKIQIQIKLELFLKIKIKESYYLLLKCKNKHLNIDK